MENKIFNHFLTREILSRGLNYKTAIQQTARVFSTADQTVEDIVLQRAKQLNLSGQQLDWLSFPQSIIDAAIEAEGDDDAPCKNPNCERIIDLNSYPSGFCSAECKNESNWNWGFGQ